MDQNYSDRKQVLSHIKITGSPHFRERERKKSRVLGVDVHVTYYFLPSVSDTVLIFVNSMYEQYKC